MELQANNNDANGKIVAVTGATGYLASHLVKQLLEKGKIILY